MSLRNTQAYPFTPVGASDCLDSSNSMKGAMTALQNLVVMPGTRNLWQCRPASLLLEDISTHIASGTFISTFKIVGNILYGLISSTTHAGHDEPFAYNILTDTYIAVASTLNNTPVSPSSSGDWVPPTMALIGTKLMVTHPGFNGTAGNYFGWFDISTPSIPTWNAGNVSGAVTFTVAPSSVFQFGQRAYYVVNPPAGQPIVYASDVLSSLIITNAGQALTFGDNQQITALGGLPLDNQLGGVIQALMVFKGVNNIFQVTGDYVTGWSANALNCATGTLAPLSICSTPAGLAFMSPEGMRLIDMAGHVSPPIGDAGNGMTTPFIYSSVPSRVCATANANIIRISTTNDFVTGSPVQEWWFHMNRQAWSGPHTFPASLIAPYNNTFVMAANGVNAKLFQSDGAQTSTSTFVENGTQMTFAWTTAMLPDTQQMCENNILEATINMALAANVSIGVSALDQDGAVLDSVVVAPLGGATIWGAFQWGQANWLGAANALYPRELQWSVPIVFRRLAIYAQGDCASGFLIGDMFLRYEQLGYLQYSAA